MVIHRISGLVAAALSAGMLLAMSSPPASAIGRVYASVTFPGENRRRQVSIIQE